MSVAYASQTLTSTGTIPTANDTVTVGGKVYTYKASVTTVDGEVDLGANAAEALANLKAAINLGAGAGSLYGSGTVVNPDVVADTLTATTLVVRAKVPGTVGNFIAATEASCRACGRHRLDQGRHRGADPRAPDACGAGAAASRSD
jgi:hypothetical protein